jgi:hypothetical protein
MASKRWDFLPDPRRAAVTESDNQTDWRGRVRSVDQAHEQVPDLGAVLVLVEQSNLAMQNDFFERPFANIIIEWSWSASYMMPIFPTV